MRNGFPSLRDERHTGAITVLLPSPVLPGGCAVRRALGKRCVSDDWGAGVGVGERRLTRKLSER